jgi:putative membrane protein
VRFLTWLATNAVALAVALWLVPGVHLGGPTSGWPELKHKIGPLIVVALILGVVNFLVKPVLKILSIPLIILTLGLFLLVINAAMLGLTSWILSGTRIGFHVDGFWPAVWAGLVVAIVGAVVRRLLEEDE